MALLQSHLMLDLSRSMVSRLLLGLSIEVTLCYFERSQVVSRPFRRSAKESFSGHTLLDVDATVANPKFKPPISMKSIQNEPWTALVKALPANVQIMFCTLWSWDICFAGLLRSWTPLAQYESLSTSRRSLHWKSKDRRADFLWVSLFSWYQWCCWADVVWYSFESQRIQEPGFEVPKLAEIYNEEATSTGFPGTPNSPDWWTLSKSASRGLSDTRRIQSHWQVAKERL